MRIILSSVQKNLIGATLIFALVGSGCDSKAPGQDIDVHQAHLHDSLWFAYMDISGIGYEKNISRRDPSDIIMVDGQYYIWYTRIPAQADGRRTPLYNSGYYGTIWYATSGDGHSWSEKGEALGPGEKGAFDSHAVFTPNILKYKGKYYLYYTGVKPTPGNSDNEFENNSETDITAIGIAVADYPDGPFKRVSGEPILSVSNDSADFDSYRIDDASLLVKGEEIWLYYKGRSKIHGKRGPGKTQMGVAFTDSPGGPYRKHSDPLVDKSHEVLVWHQKDGVASLASISRSVKLAPDGLKFSAIHENLVQIPTAPGLYRPHLAEHAIKELPGWGIAHKAKDGDIYLVRFNMQSTLK